MTITNKPFRGTDTLTDCPAPGCDNQFWQRPAGTPLTCSYHCGAVLRATQRPRLSPRESQVKELLDQGLTVEDIAQQLELMTGTIANVVTALNKKLATD